MVKAVIFDLGGVLIDVSPLMDEVNHVFQPENEEQFWQSINVEAASLCKGEITLLQFWRMVAQKVGKDIPDRVLKDLWIKDYDPLTLINEDVKDIVDALRGKYQLAILSNTIKEHTYINKRSGIFTWFDVIILSHEVALTKNEKDIFFLAAEKLDVTPGECVFIDDIHHFVAIAQSVGMHALLFEDAEKLKTDLRKWGIDI
jgi:putative hydrolase of the HAD superfamily